MCGRYAINNSVNELITEYVAAGGRADEWAASYNLAPTQAAPIIRERPDDAGTVQRSVDMASWGFWPSWVKAVDKRPRPINARFEGVASNGMFRGAFAERRCLVPMRGYFEWVTQPDGKQPYFLHHADGQLLSAAGLYAGRQDETGVWHPSFTIITRAAADASGRIHDQMPAFVTDEFRDDWLDPGKLPDAGGMLAELDHSATLVARTIATYPVGRAVNNVRTADATDPKLIVPLANPS